MSSVGHRSMGRAYNREIYARRISALESMLDRHVERPLESVRVLDVGCGSGFYTQFWLAKRVREYAGVDISGRAIEYLAATYPESRFEAADMTELPTDEIEALGQFDLVTVFDVLYHIVDDKRAARAIGNICNLVSRRGQLFIMDQLFQRHYRISKHVVARSREEYLGEFKKKGFVLAGSEPLFHFLVPPITGVRTVDVAGASVFKAVGLALRFYDPAGECLGSALRSLGRRLRQRGVVVSNSELFVFKRASASD